MLFGIEGGDWDAEHIKWNDDYVYHDSDFMERVAEYALAAKKSKHLLPLHLSDLRDPCGFLFVAPR